MYKAIIVDDERMIREGMRRAINWNPLGVEEVLTASSGSEALEIIRKENPDIMITDISMPGMTGHELIERAQKIRPDLAVIVLTGYDKFEYARRALQLHVKDFLLKPIEEEVLSGSIQKVVSELENERKKKEALKDGERLEGIAKQRTLEEKLILAVTGTPEEKAEAAFSLTKHFELSEEELLTMAILLPALKESPQDDEVVFSGRQATDICMSEIDAKGCGFTVLSAKMARILIVFFNSRCLFSPVDMLKNLDAIFTDESIPVPKAAVGTTVKGMTNIFRSYSEARILFENDKGKIEEILQMASERKRTTLFRDVFETLLSEMIQNLSNYSYVMHIYDTFEKAVDSYNLSLDYMRKCCFRIAADTYYACLGAKEIKPELNLDSFMNMIKDGSRKDCLDMTKQILTKMLNQEEEEVHVIVKQAKIYIEGHLEEELSVASLAEIFYVSPNYFSRLFKRMEGEGCNEYIVRKRMEKAKQLLDTTNFSSNRIASMVGYSDPNYFSITFKKRYGKSPLHYRNEGEKHE